MVTNVRGITAEKAAEIEAASIVGGSVNVANGHLLLTTSGGTQYDAGKIIPDTSPLAGWPVGSIYMNATVATNPAALLGGGTWVRWAGGRSPVGVDEAQTEFNAAEQTGGEKKHTLTVTELPSHNHGGSTGLQSNDHSHGVTVDAAGNHNHSYITPSLDGSMSSANNIDPRYADRGGDATGLAGQHGHGASLGWTSGDHSHSIGNSGGGEAHNVLQPYIVCYIWKRVA